MRKTLLLNSNYQALRFLAERRALCLLIKDKVEVLSEWEDHFDWSGKKHKYPATLRLKYLVKIPEKDLSFSRYSVFRRDQFSCQYCGESLNVSTVTLDHVVPKIAGGKTTFLNCVTSCYLCNNKKGGRTPEQAAMNLIRQPFIPSLKYIQEINNKNFWHDSWDFYYRSNDKLK